MTKAIEKILRGLEKFKKTPACVGLDIRLSLTEIIIKRLKILDWEIEELAKRTGLTKGYLSRILHSNVNCSADTMGKILFALGTRVRLKEVNKED